MSKTDAVASAARVTPSDQERLDWIENHNCALYLDKGEWQLHVNVIEAPGLATRFNGKSARDAIDAAMSEFLPFVVCARKDNPHLFSRF